MAKNNKPKGKLIWKTLCGGNRDMMYDVNAALIIAMIADTEDFSFDTNPAENNLYYSVSNGIRQTLMSRFCFCNAFDVVFKQSPNQERVAN